ncbi:MAG: hypothetical protein WC476_01685 [Phycisphaerae bacterium]|jgi:hypothetical protein
MEVIGYIYEGVIICPNCYEQHVKDNGFPNPNDYGVIFDTDEVDHYPVCDRCATPIEDATLTEYGVFYELSYLLRISGRVKNRTKFDSFCIQYGINPDKAEKALAEYTNEHPEYVFNPPRERESG